ncbi:MAG TPA: hypothetical protein VF796_05345 [Humisphaera sp.]
MTVKFSNPEVEQYVAEQVRAGRFASAEALVQQAVERMMNDDSVAVLADDDRAAIAEADAQVARGEVTEFHAVADRLRARLKARFGGT